MSEDKWGKLHIKDMTNSHLMKSRAMLMRGIAKSERWIAKFEIEMSNRGNPVKEPYLAKGRKTKLK